MATRKISMADPIQHKVRQVVVHAFEHRAWIGRMLNLKAGLTSPDVYPTVHAESTLRHTHASESEESDPDYEFPESPNGSWLGDLESNPEFDSEYSPVSSADESADEAPAEEIREP